LTVGGSEKLEISGQGLKKVIKILADKEDNFSGKCVRKILS